MQIEWESEQESPYLFSQAAEWTGIGVGRARVVPGRMPEQTLKVHYLNVSIAGDVITQKLSGTGRLISTRGSAGNICLTPAGQPLSAFWQQPIDIMHIRMLPAFVRETAVENHLSPSFDLIEIYREKILF